MKQDLEDLNEDINTLIDLYEGKIDISLKQRLRFQWINRLNDYVDSYKEIKELIERKMGNVNISPWEAFIYPISNISNIIDESDERMQKLWIFNEMISECWQQTITSYICGLFLCVPLLCSICIELLEKALILRDDPKYYKEIKGETGFIIKKLNRRYKITGEIKDKLDKLQTLRGKIIAHPTLVIEKMAKEGKLRDLLMHDIEWHNKKLIKEEQYEGYSIEKFRNIARESIEITLDLLEWLSLIHI